MLNRIARYAAAFVACASLAAPAAAADAPATLRVATTPIDVGAEVYYAQDMGFFKKAGLDVQVQTISNGGAIAAAVAGGSIDIGQGNVLSLITAFKRGIPIAIVAPAGKYSSEHPTSQLLVKKDAPYKTAADLNGKTLAVNGLRNILELGFDAWSEKNGGNVKSVHFAEFPFSQMEGALAAGRVDAAFMAEPALGEARKTARVLADPYSAIGSNWLIGAWFANTSWAKQHPDLVKRFDEVMRETAAWANKNPEKSAEILAKYSKVPLPVVKAMARSVYPEHTNPAEIQPVVDAAAHFGFIDASFPASELLAR